MEFEFKPRGRVKRYDIDKFSNLTPSWECLDPKCGHKYENDIEQVECPECKGDVRRAPRSRG